MSERAREYQRARLANETPEQRAARLERQREYERARYAKAKNQGPATLTVRPSDV